MSDVHKILDAAIDYIAEASGSCPLDLHGFEVSAGCDKVCGDKELSSCWFEYFATKAVE